MGSIKRDQHNMMLMFHPCFRVRACGQAEHRSSSQAMRLMIAELVGMPIIVGWRPTQQHCSQLLKSRKYYVVLVSDVLPLSMYVDVQMQLCSKQPQAHCLSLQSKESRQELQSLLAAPHLQRK
jgi:hypothetical protein